MINLTYMDYLKLVAALVTSIGGSGVIILGLSKFFGDFLANKLLGDFKNKHERELEGIKSKYQKELEQTKNELEKTKLLFTRYSEKQFAIYNTLWGNLLYTRKQATELWQSPLLEKIPAFAQQIIQARTAIDENMLLIASTDFNKLDTLIKRFENWDINGVKLNALSGHNLQVLQSTGLNDSLIQSATLADVQLVNDCNTIIGDVGESFRNQIKGRNHLPN